MRSANMKYLPGSLFFLCFIFCVTKAHAKNLTVTVLYESLCPDSVNFLKDQFYPAYSTVLKDKINVELVPFGKANATKENGTWAFQCQHREKECYGNKIQACAIDLAPNSLSTEFVVCAMKSGDAGNDDNLQQCAKDFNVSWSGIQECIKSGKGNELLAKNGDRTNALRPNIPNVPTIIFNDKYKDVLQKLALVDFHDVSELLLEENSHINGSSRISSFSILVCFVSLVTFFKLF